MSHCCNTLHIIFGTKYRHRTLCVEKLTTIHRYIGMLCKQEGVFLRIVGGVEDHVHILIDLPPTMTVAHFVNRIKALSSRDMKNLLPMWEGWADGYGCFSVSPDRSRAVYNYILHQFTHHKHNDFLMEYNFFLTAYGIIPKPDEVCGDGSVGEDNPIG